MKARAVVIRTLAAVGFLSAAPSVFAAPVTWAMEGTIQVVDDPLGLIGFAQVGERVQYTFTFDSDTPDTNPTDTLATYLGTASTFRVGTTWLEAGVPQIDIQRHPTVHVNDMFDVFSWFQYDGMGGSVYFRLLDPLGTVLPGTELPAEPYPLAGFAGASFNCTIVVPYSPSNPTTTDLVFYGTIDSFYVVPEPGSFLLLALACLIINVRRGL